MSPNYKHRKMKRKTINCASKPLYSCPYFWFLVLFHIKMFPNHCRIQGPDSFVFAYVSDEKHPHRRSAHSTGQRSPPTVNPGSATAREQFIAIGATTDYNQYFVSFKQTFSVADPGFPIGGAPTSDVGAFRQKHVRK